MIAALYEIISCLPLSLISLMLLGGYAGIPEKSPLAYIVCIAFTVWVILLRSMKTKNRLRSLGIAAVFAVGAGLAAGEDNRLLFIEKYHWIFWVICFCLAAAAAGILMNRDIRLKRAAAAVFVICCTAGVILGTGMSKGAFALMCFDVLILAAEEVQRKWKKSGTPDMKKHITMISPFLIVLCTAVFLIPAPDTPYSWKFAKKIYYKTVSCFERIYGRLAHTKEEYGNIGFSDNGSFLSGLGGADEEVLYIKLYSSKVNELRLIGCISGDFRGDEWVFDTGSESISRTIDTMETLSAARKYAGTSRSDYYLDIYLHYENLFYNTKYVFSPAKFRQGVTNNSGFSEKNGSLISDSSIRFRDTYSVSCYALNYNEQYLKDLIENAVPVTEAEWEQSALSEKMSEVPGCSFEDYLKYRTEVYEKYAQPQGLSPRVKKILEEINSSSATRYEAVKKLETYLRQFEYSVNCGALPKSVSDAESFVDYFLFDSRKGYCMHFATAFVLMANEMGVPARYVQGYKASRSPDGTIIVKDSCAHAWPEVYFDNVGWVAFEPTPGSAVSSGWEVKDSTDGSDTAEKQIPPDKDVTAADTGAFDGDTALPEQPKTGISPLVIIIPVLSVAGFLLLFYLISRLMSAGKYRRMSAHEKLRYLTKQDLRFLDCLGHGINEGETLTEYQRRLSSSDAQQISGLLGFIPVYETVIYSDREVTEDDVTFAEKTHDSLRRMVKKRRVKSIFMRLTEGIHGKRQ